MFSENDEDEKSSAVKDGLRALGFYRATDNISLLLDQAAAMNESATDTKQKFRFEALPSYIPLEDKKATSGPKLVVDIGGTSTKAGICESFSPETEKWSFLFENINAEIQSKDKGDSLESFAAMLGQMIAEGVKKVGFSLAQIEHAGFVWSNAMDNQPLSGDCRGVTGRVVARDQYMKNEWFVRDVQDGRDIGKALLDGLRAAGLAHIRTLVVGNDAALTAKASAHADAGIVASTGLNGTLVKSLRAFGGESDALVLCNGETGGRFTLAETFLSDADYIGLQDRAETIEQLSAGKFLPQVYSEHLCRLFEMGVPGLEVPGAFLKKLGAERFEYFRARDVALPFLNDIPLFLSRRKNPEFFPERCMAVLAEIGREMYIRSARLCAVLVYAGICNRFHEKDAFQVSVDSRLAREIPLFKSEFCRAAEGYMPAGKKVNICFVDQLSLMEGNISVPMIGAARALDALAQ